MVFQNLWLDVLLACTVAALVYMLARGFSHINKRMRLRVVLLRMVVFATAVGAIAFVVYNGWDDPPNFQPLQSWRRIGELGYKAVALEMAFCGIPFMIPGFFMPMAYSSVYRTRRAFFMGLVMMLALGIVRAALGSFNIDELFYCVMGTVAGFALSTLLSWILPKVRVFSITPFKKHTHIFGVFYLMATYFLIVLAMVLDNGSQVVKLSLPANNQPLPVNTTFSLLELDNDQERVDTYEAVAVTLEKDAARIGAALGMRGQVEMIGETGARLVDGAKTLQLNISGYWSYADGEAAAATGSAPDDETCIRAAKDAALSGVARGFGVAEAVIESEIVSDDGTLVQKEVYITAQYSGYSVLGACEFFIVIGENGQVVSIEKYDPDFQPFKTVKTIGAQQAYEKVKKYIEDGSLDESEGSISHTLYKSAGSAVIDEYFIRYWLEEANGILQPVWAFRGTATMEDGSSQTFEVYVPAVQ